ncbi:peptide transporter PTR2, partial [Trifolium medium]|nr:peptide transporter PTR2 [Trifolium medium]
TDNGPEFFLTDFFAKTGILHQKSCVETPQQNARVERKHQHILNVARALLFQSHLPKQFWSYAVMHAVFLINRISTPILNNKSPYFCLLNKSPDLANLKCFGSLAYASTLQNHRTKLSCRARKCAFLGFKTGMKGVVLVDIDTREILVSTKWSYYPSSSSIPVSSSHDPLDLTSSPDSHSLIPIPDTTIDSSPTISPNPPETKPHLLT